MSSHRLTIDEIGPDNDGNHLATLVDDSGRSIVLPVELLPDGARLGDVVTLTIEQDHAETVERAERVAELQRRLFGRRNRPTPS